MTADVVVTKPAPNFAFMAQHLFTAILWVDEELTITWLNAQAEQLLATSSGRLLGQSILALLTPKTSTSTFQDHPKDHLKTHSDTHSSKKTKDVACSLTERFRQAKVYQQPFIDHDHLVSTQLNNHTALLIDYSVTPVIDEQQHGFIIEMWGKDRQSRISEEQRQQQQYNVARQMLRSVAHEIKNPLAGIRGAAQLLQRKFIKFSEGGFLADAAHTQQSAASPPPDKQKNAAKLRSYTDIIIAETDRLTQLIGQLLGSNQLPNWQMLNIHEPLEHVLSLIVNQYPQVTLQRDYDLSLPELCADKDQLIQVFLNLINNACESMTELEQTLQQHKTSESQETPQATMQMDSNSTYQPILHLQTRVVFQHTIGSQQHKQVLQVTITDNGSGIDADLIGQIFFPMVTSRAAGTGLGLSIVQDIISRHHGMIDVSSAQSDTHHTRQTQFALYLPFSQPDLTIKTS